MPKLVVTLSLFLAVALLAVAGRRIADSALAARGAPQSVVVHSIMGNVCQNAGPDCIYITETAILHLEPGGRQMLSGFHGQFEFDAVLDGAYTLTLDPPCLSVGCYAALPVTIDGIDARVLLFPDPGILPATPTETPSPTDTPAPTDTPSATDTATATASATDTPPPTETPSPTDTPSPTNTPAATATPTATPAPNLACLWDVNSDGIVNSIDLLVVARHFGGRTSGRYFSAYDLNGDGWINSIDLLITARHYGSCPD